jgi:hypothetical protein
MSAAYLFLWIVGSSHLEMLATERANIIFYGLLLRSPSKTLQMLKEAYGKAVTASVVYCSEFLAIDPVAGARFPALPEKKSSGTGTGSTQPRDCK